MLETRLHIIANRANGLWQNYINTRYEASTCLTENGARVDARNQDGKTAMDVATSDRVREKIREHTNINHQCIASNYFCCARKWQQGMQTKL